MYTKTFVSRERQRCPDYCEKSKWYFMLGLLKIKMIKVRLSVESLNIGIGG